MTRTVTIATAHSNHQPASSMRIEMDGGDPWFADIWINDERFTIYRDDETEKISVESDSVT